MQTQTASPIRTGGETLAHSISHTQISPGMRPDAQNEKGGMTMQPGQLPNADGGEVKTSRDTALQSRSACMVVNVTSVMF